MVELREQYLKTLIDFKDTEFIKVITGVRRSGKSFLLKMFKNHLHQAGIKDSNIIYINFEHPDSEGIKSYLELNAYLKSLAQQEGKYYFLFDEIQEVDGWEKVVNGLRVAYDSDIYITGSNAKLLSGELATYLSGRYVEVKVMPLSFKEFCDFKHYKNKMEYMTYFTEFMDIGAFPSVALLQNINLIDSVLQGIFDSILLKDISLRGNIKDTSLLLRVVKFLLDNIGNPISSSSIANTLSSSGRKTTNETVDKYRLLLEESLVFYKAERFDIRGKERLKTLAKYYVVDLGLRNAVLGKNRGNYGIQLENIVYLELVRRGYEVSVGKFNDTEIDFVCNKSSKTLYVQVAHTIPDSSKRETDNLKNIRDNYEKILVVGNQMDAGMVDGIHVIHVVDFLLDSDEIQTVSK